MPGVIPLRKDSQDGLTIAQFAAMPAKLKKRAAANPGDVDAQTLLADIPIWQKASNQLKGEDGKWSIVWSKVNASYAGMKESDVDGLLEEIEESDDGEFDADKALDASADLMEVALEEIGRRNSAADSGTLQSAHDALVKAGAVCNPVANVAESLVEVEYSGDAEDINYNESGAGDIGVTFAEADPEFNDETHEVTITPIKPGPGNKKDGFYYPSKTIREAVEAGRFNNIKMYANHPTKTGARELPERDVKDWVGVIKETVWDEANDRPRSRLKVLDDGVWQKFREAPEHIAYSVLGGGRARPGTIAGKSQRIVESMDKVRSIDWVTEAGAGGGITFAESADEEFDMDINELTIEQVREGNPDLFAAIREETATADKAKADAAAKAEDAKAATAEKAVKDEADKAKGTKAGDDAGSPTPDGFVSKEDFDALKKDFDAASAKVTKAETKEADGVANESAQELIIESLKGSLLPNKSRDYILARFEEATLGEGYIFAEAEDLTKAVDAEVTAIKALTTPVGSSVTGLGAASDDDDDDGVKSIKESKEDELLDRIMGNDDLPRDASNPAPSIADKAEEIASRM